MEKRIKNGGHSNKVVQTCIKIQLLNVDQKESNKYRH
jgi:hypothetical protein